MPTVLLAGAHEHQSPDHEAMLAAFRGALPDWRIVTTGGAPASGAVEARARRSLGRTLLNADAVVFVGGTVFTTHPSTARSPHDLLTRALLLAGGGRAAGKPVAMLGVAADQLPDARARWLARALVRRADLLVLCDEESAHVLATVGAPIPFRVGADPVWTLVDHAPVARKDRDGVVVALGDLPGDANLADRLAGALGPLADTGVTVQLQPWHGGDRPTGRGGLASAVATRLNGRVEVATPPANLLDAWARIAGARLAVCLSSHAMIAAAAVGTPLVALAHQLKLIGLARRLQQPAAAITADPALIAGTLLSGLDAQPASPHAVHAEIARAAEGFRLLRLLLTQGTLSELDSLDGLSLVPAPWTAR